MSAVPVFDVDYEIQKLGMSVAKVANPANLGPEISDFSDISRPQSPIATEPEAKIDRYGLTHNDLEQCPVPTAPETDPTARVVQEKLLAGESVRMHMGDIGEAYWVVTDMQRDKLVTELTANGDDTPVFCWGELVRISNWSQDDKLFAYRAKQTFQATIGEPSCKT